MRFTLWWELLLLLLLLDDFLEDDFDEDLDGDLTMRWRTLGSTVGLGRVGGFMDRKRPGGLICGTCVSRKRLESDKWWSDS